MWDFNKRWEMKMKKCQDESPIKTDNKDKTVSTKTNSRQGKVFYYELALISEKDFSQEWDLSCKEVQETNNLSFALSFI